ncbi:MAG TPA: Ca2+-dependent phosphoinositide-specific phospholipase C [Spirochaetales bacterium]|nr:Ca2+-dependent phosphoinositide-specific phospholipase C [Spirochaetales bacterium]
MNVRRVARTAALAAVAVVLSIAVFIGGSVAYFKLSRASDFGRQERRLALLEDGDAVLLAGMANSPEALVAESGGLDLPWNRTRVVATHNSYHLRPGALRSFILGIAKPAEPAKLAYSHRTLTEQLDSGVRSFELDVRLRAGRFEITHVPLVDDRTASPDLGLAFRELALWSARHPDHLPLVVLLELKDDWMVLDGKLEAFDGPALGRLSDLAASAFGDSLFGPGELPAPVDGTVKWPKLRELAGTVMVVVHENDQFRGLLLEIYGPELAGSSLFTCAPPGSPDAAFAILNDPADPRIPEYLDRGIVVRTRADADTAVSSAQAAAALTSGAQLVSTDYPPGGPAHKSGYWFSYSGNLAALRP